MTATTRDRRSVCCLLVAVAAFCAVGSRALVHPLGHGGPDDGMMMLATYALPYVMAGLIATFGFPDRRVGLVTVCFLAAGAVGLAGYRLLVASGSTGAGCMAGIGRMLDFAVELMVVFIVLFAGVSSIGNGAPAPTKQETP